MYLILKIFNFVFQIDVKVIQVMEDKQLAEYVPAYGDRVALVSQCALMCEPEGKSEKPEAEKGLLSRIKFKMRKKRKTEVSNPMLGNQNAAKQTRRVEFGWKDYDHKEQEYKQVRGIRSGGGTRHLKVPKSGNEDTLLEAGKNLFFPNGISKRGNVDSFTFSITDYQGNSLGALTVEEYYSLHGLKMLRVYLCTKKDPVLNTEATTTTSEQNTCPIEPLQVQCLGENAYRTQDSSIEVQLSADVLSTSQFSPLHESVSNLPLSPVIFDENGSNNAAIAENGSASVINQFPYLELATFETPQSGNLGSCTVNLDLQFSQQDSMSVNHPPSMEAQETSLAENADNHSDQANSPTTDLKVHRVNIVKEMIGFFKNEEIMQRNIQFSFMDEVGYDATGVSREAYTIFWENFMASSADGETYRIPALNPDFALEEWQSIGRILAKGYKDHNVFPLSLAPAFFIAMMFGEEMVSPEELLHSYYLFVSESDRDILQSAVMGTLKDEGDKDILLDLLDQEGVRHIPQSDDEVHQTIIQMAHKALIQESSYALQIMRDAVQKELLSFFPDIERVKKMYDCLTPTSKKVCQLLKAEPQNKDESQSLKFFQQFVRAQKEDNLAKLLHFLTGSRVLSVNSIGIEFCNRKGLERRPIAHTCGPVLELPSTYAAYRELRNEFESVLSSGYLKMDIL